jgi:MFS family permease
VLVLLAAAAVRRQAAFRRRDVQSVQVSGAMLHHPKTRSRSDRRAYLLLTAPLFVGMPMVVTATIFHQALLAEALGVTLQWFAVSFVAFAISRVAASILTGPLVDCLGSNRLFWLHLLPLAAGIAALVVVPAPWVIPLFWFGAGVASGMGAILQTTVIAERVPAARLGTARSVLAAVTIVASAAGPTLYGLALAAGARASTVLWSSVAALLMASALGLIAAKREEV